MDRKKTQTKLSKFVSCTFYDVIVSLFSAEIDHSFSNFYKMEAKKLCMFLKSI